MGENDQKLLEKLFEMCGNVQKHAKPPPTSPNTAGFTAELSRLLGKGSNAN